MNKTFYHSYALVFTLLLITSTCFSQKTSIQGKILNYKNNKPIPFVNIGIKGTYSGTTTNNNGEFSLNLPSNIKYRTLVFSCIGYESKEYTVRDIENAVSIRLTPLSYDISEVTIMPDSTLRSFLRKAYRMIPTNYPTHLTKYEGFYRVSIQNNKGEYLRFMEVLTEAYKSTYQNSESGTVKVVNSRKYVSEHNLEEFPIIFYGGIYYCHTADFVKNRSDFLKGNNRYNYKLTGSTKYHDKVVLSIDFEPVNPNSRNKSKGTIFIDKESLAYIKIIKTFTEEELKARSQTLGTKLSGIKSTSKSVTVNYSNNKGTYYLKSIYENEEIESKEKHIVSCPLEYLVTSITEEDIDKLPYDSITPITYIPAMEATNYSETNWHDYNTLPLNTSLQLDSIKAKQLLSTQGKEKKDWRIQYLNILKKFEFEFGIEASQMQRASGDYSLNYQDLNFQQNISHADYQYGLYSTFDYKLTSKNRISYKRKSNLLKKDFIKFDAFRYKRLFPIKTMGKQIIANVNAGWVWQKLGYSLGTTHSESNFKFGGKKFKNDKVEAFTGLKTNGLSLGGGLDIQISHFFYLSASANYIIPAKTEHILILKERSGFFLFRKTAWENINDQDIDFSIDGVTQTHSGMSFNNWAVSVGIKIKL